MLGRNQNAKRPGIEWQHSRPARDKATPRIGLELTTLRWQHERMGSDSVWAQFQAVLGFALTAQVMPGGYQVLGTKFESRRAQFHPCSHAETA